MYTLTEFVYAVHFVIPAWRPSPDPGLAVSVEVEVAGYRVDEVVVVGADGQAGPGGDAAELGQAAVGDQVHLQARVAPLVAHPAEILLGVHRGRDLAETARQPGLLGG